MMDTDRTPILDHPRNSWLEQEAAGFAVELLMGDWLT